MLRSILGTLGTKFAIALINFAAIVLTTHFLGADGRGEVSLLTLNITMLVLCSNFMGGPNLVYLIPRYALQKLVLPSYLWAFISCAIGWFILEFLNLNLHFGIHVFALALLECIGNVNAMSIWGKNNIKAFNLITLARFVTIISVFAYLILIENKTETNSYVFSLYAANGLYLLLSQVKLVSYLESLSLTNVMATVKATFTYGTYSQIGSLAQLLNYRFSFLLLEQYWGTAMVGVYSTGVALAEAFWLISRSVSQVQYAAISNTEDNKHSMRVTLILIKINVIATLCFLVPALIVPTEVYTWIFGSGFSEVKTVLLLLAPGIVAVSFSAGVSHFLAGIGKHKFNAITTVLGLLVTVIGGLLLIPLHQLVGAAITADLSYLAMAGYNLFLLSKHGAKVTDIAITKKDVEIVFGSIKKFFGVNKK